MTLRVTGSLSTHSPDCLTPIQCQTSPVPGNTRYRAPRPGPACGGTWRAGRARRTGPRGGRTWPGPRWSNPPAAHPWLWAEHRGCKQGDKLGNLLCTLRGVPCITRDH